MENFWFDSISFIQDVQSGSGAHTASYSVGSLGSFLGIKRLGREANHSLLCNSEAKNEGLYVFYYYHILSYSLGSIFYQCI